MYVLKLMFVLSEKFSYQNPGPTHDAIVKVSHYSIY